jgi:flagellar protein FliS
MNGNYGFNQYKTLKVKTASRGELLILLYESAIQNVKKAIVAIEKKDILEKAKCIGKAHDIINELLNTLDFEIGGTIALELEKLYNFMVEQLMKANLENNQEPLVAITSVLENLLSGWKVAVAQFGKENQEHTG